MPTLRFFHFNDVYNVNGAPQMVAMMIKRRKSPKKGVYLV